MQIDKVRSLVDHLQWLIDNPEDDGAETIACVHEAAWDLVNASRPAEPEPCFKCEAPIKTEDNFCDNCGVHL